MNLPVRQCDKRQTTSIKTFTFQRNTVEMHKKITDLSPAELENLSFDLLLKLGIKNLVWRTPGRDGGRDLQGEFFIEDISGFTNRQSWYVDCKRYNTSVSWPVVWEKISYAESNSADALLIVTTTSLSPQAVDEVNKWNEKRNRLAIRFWNSVDLESRLKPYPEISIKYGLANNPEESKGLAILPLTRILLKYSNSAHSCHVFGYGQGADRLNDFDRDNSLSIYPYKSKEDSFDWIRGDEIIETLGFDKYAFRALSSYVYEITPGNELRISERNGSAYIEVGQSIPANTQEDIIDISLLSNFQISFEELGIILTKSKVLHAQK